MTLARNPSESPQDSPSTGETSATPNHGCLPAWKSADLPEPRPFTLKNLFKTIGPGAILLAAAIGGGEWIVGPSIALKHGAGILWVATAAIILQVIFNLEGVRYTLYTGEPILTGIMRLRPGSKFWSAIYVGLAVAQLATPALAAGAAVVIASTILGRLATEGDYWLRYGAGAGIIIVSVILLLKGKSIERTLERLSWFMIAVIFLFLIGVNVFFVPAETSAKTFVGFVVPQALPNDVDLVLLAVFAAVSGSGGIGNLVISNWFRDKGFGMAAHVGGIGGALAHNHQELKSTGFVFPVTRENLRRWKTWWRYAEIDQAVLWGMGCLLGMFLNVNLMIAIAPDKPSPNDFGAGALQAEFLSRHLGPAFWYLTLLNGFWILYSTHLGNTDGLVRTVCDVLWVAYPRVQRLTASRLYAILLLALTIWALISVNLGSAIALFKILGVVAAPIMALGAIQILHVNRTLLPRELRPPLWRQIMMVLCALVYAALTVASVYSLLNR